MKVLLVNPPVPKRTILNVLPPIGLGYLSTALKKNGIVVNILDCIKKKLAFSDFVEEVKKSQPEVIGIQVFSHAFEMVKKGLTLIRKAKDDVVIVVGGPHPSGLPEETLYSMKEADFGFRGEAEIGLPMLIKQIINFKNPIDIPPNVLEEVPGLIWRRNSRVICNSPVFVENLDELGCPDWELINPREYPQAPQGVVFKNWPAAPIVATRGCPFNCTFCAGSTISGRKTRFRSIKNIIEEIKFLSSRFGVKEIHILDDNFMLKRQYVRNFCRALIDDKIEISWCCPNGVRLDNLDEETLLLMKKSGCYYISVGIESGSSRILAHMKKGFTTVQVGEKVSLARKAGLAVNGFFILGYPEEKRQDILQTIRFAQELRLTRAAFFNFLPLPGTEIYTELKQKGKIQKLQLNKLYEAYVPYAPEGISKKELKNLQRRAYLKFYLRPKTLVALLKEIKTLNQLKFIVRRFFTYLWCKGY